MLFFKKYRKKIGVCVAMLGVLCCTVFGFCSMKGTSTVTANAAVYDDNVTPNMFTEQFIDNCADTVNIFPSRALEDDLDSLFYYDYSVVFMDGLYCLGFVGNYVEDKDVFFEWSFANSTYNNHMKVGQTYTLVVKQYYLSLSDTGNNVGIYGVTGSQTFDTIISTSNDTISVTFTVTSSSDFVQLYYNTVKNDVSGGIDISVALYKGSVNYGVTSPLQAIVDSAYYNGQQAGGGTGGGYTQEDLDQAFQDGVNSVDTNAIRQEGYSAGYQAGLAAGSGTTEEVLQAEYERGYQAGVASIDQSAIRQEGYDEGYSAGLQAGSGVSEETLQAEYERGYQAGYESGYGEGFSAGVNSAGGVADYGIMSGCSFTYRLYNVKKQDGSIDEGTVETPLTYTVPFDDLVKDNGRIYIDSETLRTELYALAPYGWNRVELFVKLNNSYFVNNMNLGYDTSNRTSNYLFVNNVAQGKLDDNNLESQVSSRYIIQYDFVGDSATTDWLIICMDNRVSGIPASFYSNWIFGSDCFVTGNNEYAFGYNEGYSNGRLDGLKEGEDIGYDKGKDVGLQQGEVIGYDKGYDEGFEQADKNNFVTAVSAIIGAPITVVKSFLSFELLGVNLLAAFAGIITLMIIIKCIKVFLK